MGWHIEREDIGGDPNIPPANRTGLIIVDDESEMVCTLYTHMGWGFVRHGDDEANARLIAAAPDLLAALNDLVKAYRSARRRLGYEDGDESDSLDLADAAIAKAEGRS